MLEAKEDKRESASKVNGQCNVRHNETDGTSEGEKGSKAPETGAQDVCNAELWEAGPRGSVAVHRCREDLLLPQMLLEALQLLLQLLDLRHLLGEEGLQVACKCVDA